MPLIRARLKGGQPVKDVEMDTAPSRARTRRLVRKTALRSRLDNVKANSVVLFSAGSFWASRQV